MKKTETKQAVVHNRVVYKPYPSWKRYLWSGGRVFVATFVYFLGMALQNVNVEMLHSAFWSTIDSVLITALALTFKGVSEYCKPVK